MKGSVLALDHIGGHQAAARIVNGRLDDLLIDRAPAPPAPGAIFRARIERPLKGLGATLLRLPADQQAFLREPLQLPPGAAVLVQVTGYAEPGKAAPVTTRLLFKGHAAIVTPGAAGLNLSRQIDDPSRREALLRLAAAGMAGSDMGLVLRTAADVTADAEVAAEIAALRGIAESLTRREEGAPEQMLAAPSAHELALRDWPRADLTDAEDGSFGRHGVGDHLDGLRSERVALAGGGSAFVELTRALVAIDVNTGEDLSPAAGLKANLALARELPRQLRLRGLGGQIVLDLAPMPKKDRAGFEGQLRAAFRADPIETALMGWTALGHYELRRKRERLPITPDLLP